MAEVLHVKEELFLKNKGWKKKRTNEAYNHSNK